MSDKKLLAVEIGGVEVDVKSMSRAQMLELTKLRKAFQKDKGNEQAEQDVHDFMEHVLKDLYPQLADGFDACSNRELLVLATVTEHFSAAMPVEVIETLLKNA
ncbi:hypothetical protein [Halodesulfovibrio aestuarii]|uniref:Uncharacterized protein n=1 Tax=Halodesulfovibrio aestuarii TaxID=126333 RepID=A0ABV4JW69_9BACT